MIFVAVFRWVLFYHVGGFGLIYARSHYDYPKRCCGTTATDAATALSLGDAGLPQ
ncbi:MAG: hypothetical protein H0A76_12930 [Candidatus Thiodubiliella endoseptemdiera]|uniref:Uncharacterized protein n=1 Tax=Candidatus Thiodubiliella endoseptemdiera TaxID=2738886 RepID=A0A853F5L4_9GAMM|nr:hypothetical protein [Candidatus Thiodubiliella endoseptemdiera]